MRQKESVQDIYSGVLGEKSEINLLTCAEHYGCGSCVIVCKLKETLLEPAHTLSFFYHPPILHNYLGIQLCCPLCELSEASILPLC